MRSSMFFKFATIVATALLLCSGCTLPTDSDKEQLQPSSTEPTTGSATSSLLRTTQPAGQRSLATEFEILSSSMDGRVGVAVAPIGGDNAISFGTWSEGAAWSTMKVPLAIAALDSDTGSTDDISTAITSSDNAAAQSLWDSLGVNASQELTQVLRAGGDSVTQVPERTFRPEYSVFGQTNWPLVRQAIFTAHLPCIDHGNEVLNLMGNVVSGQSWGLGGIFGAQFKGGWGPDEVTGGYMVRQMGVVNTPHGSTAITVAAEPTSGTFADGILLLDTLSSFLDEHLNELPAGSCA